MTDEKLDIVFVVDDSRTSRAMLARVLEKMNFKILEAGSGEEAIELLKTTIPDAILLDVEMPGMGGFVTCEKIREISQAKYIPIMMVTSLEDLESITKAYKAGATDFATKPINWDIIGHRVKYMVRTSHDFIELQKIRHDLNLLNLQLEERVIKRTEQLKNSNDEVKKALNTLRSTQDQLVESEKLASLGGLVAGIAHEVNTPLGITVTGVSILKDKAQKIEVLFSKKNLKRTDLGEFLSSVEEIIKISEINLQHAVELIQSFKQVSADQISERRRVFDLQSYLEEVVASLMPMLTKTKLELTIECPQDIELDSYPGVISRVITILIVNSIMHGFDPGEQGILVLHVQMRKDDKVELTYTDNGKGVSPENLKKIFEPFFTTRRGSGGIGLGLNIAYNHVTKLLGGTIKCTSTLGKGFEVSIIFPKKAV